MSITRLLALAPCLLAAALMTSGCGGSVSTLTSLTLPGPTSDAPPPPATQAPEPVGDTTPVAVEHLDGSATDIYSRIATGAMSCWFAVGGPLKKDYIYHASADAPSRGGKAEIVIHQRDLTQPNPRGPKSYLVHIEPTGDASATLRIENLKMAQSASSAMTDDVSRWAKGEEGCRGPSTAANWLPAPPGLAQSPAKPITKKQKAKVKAAQTKPAAAKPAQ